MPRLSEIRTIIDMHDAERIEDRGQLAVGDHLLYIPRFNSDSHLFDLFRIPTIEKDDDTSYITGLVREEIRKILRLGNDLWVRRDSEFSHDRPALYPVTARILAEGRIFRITPENRLYQDFWEKPRYFSRYAQR